MDEKEKREIVKRHFIILEKVRKLEEKFLWASMIQKARALKMWKKKFRKP